MGVTTPKAIFFHLPRTGGTWIEESLKRAVKDTEKVVCDFGFDLEINGIHIPPSKVEYDKFAFTIVRHPVDWYVSYYQFLVKDRSWDTFVEDTLGRYTWVVRQFEDVDFVGRTENLYFDVCDALDMAGEDYDEDKLLSQHINTSIKKVTPTDEQTKKILEAESYVVEKYYED